MESIKAIHFFILPLQKNIYIWNKFMFVWCSSIPSLSPKPCCKIYNFENLHCRWKLLDFAELKRSSISFFEIQKPETAVSRWSRARTRAAKVIIEL